MLGAGLAMDAFSVSLANGLNEKEISFKKVTVIAATFALFQFAMPLIGWWMVSTAEGLFEWFDRLVPWAALLLLSYIGGGMIRQGASERKSEEEPDAKEVGARSLLVQGVATSIDALSVGLTTAGYGFGEAFLSAVIIGTVTFAICVPGVVIGHKAGTRLSWKASVLGGVILLAIGIEIWIKGMGFLA